MTLRRILILVLACSACSNQPLVKEKTQETKIEEWTSSFDFDNDQIADTVLYTFTGGAHCCYQIGIRLSRTHKEFQFPFYLDGGYLAGLDLSQPRNFDIKDFDGDGVPEIFAHINRYNGVDDAIPANWTTQYGFKTNQILIKIVENGLSITDFKLP